MIDDHDAILVALRRIIRAVDLHSRHLVKNTGLTIPQVVVLQALARHAPVNSGTLSREVSLSPPTVTAIVDRLVKSGLVERTRSEVDRRATLIALTRAGQEAVAGAPELLQAEFLKQFRALPTWEQHMLIAALQRIAVLMDAEALDADPILTASEFGGREPPRDEP